MHPRVKEQLPIVKQNLAARPLFESLAIRTFQKYDALGQNIVRRESYLVAIGDG